MARRDKLSVLREKLEALEIASATTSNASTKFEYEQEIREIRAKIEQAACAGSKDESGPSRIAPTHLTPSASRLFGRAHEFRDLDIAWQSQTTNVLSIVAWGGIGKTSLVGKWAATLAQRDYDGARYFDWAFHSQGIREQGDISADSFIAAALVFFGDHVLAQSAAHPWDKGTRLAQLVARERTLLVLDGIESLQYSPSMLDGGGMLKHLGVEALLKGLAQGNAGLCVVTTRVRVADLESFRDTTSPEMKLDHLDAEASIELLKYLGVRGADDDFDRLASDVNGHALTLTLLGRYLGRAHAGDIRRRDHVRIEKADAQVHGGRAFKVMAAYERWLAEGGDNGARDLAVLRLLGLFDRPADPGCLAALRASPVIPGVTELLTGISNEEWNLAIASLKDCGLVTQLRTSKLGIQALSAEPGLDTHPIVREYFAIQLREHRAEGWRFAHLRLYEYLRDTTKDLPGTLEGLEPLFQAVAHGCQAGIAERAHKEIYTTRVSRGAEGFCTKKLGGFAASLGTLAWFFEKPWTDLVVGISDETKALLLFDAAFHLQSLGRLNEAREAVRASLNFRKPREDWWSLALRECRLSEIELELGEVADAVAAAERAASSVQAVNNWKLRRICTVILAAALHQAGHRGAAQTRFERAESLQKRHQSRILGLYSSAGFHYCELLLDEPERAAWSVWVTKVSCTESGAIPKKTLKLDHLLQRCESVEQRAKFGLEMAKRQGFLLDLALHLLILGRAALYKLVLSASLEDSQLSASNTYIAKAMDGFRNAGFRSFQVSALLSRAWLRSLQSSRENVLRDLEDARQIAQIGPMQLHMADIQLLQAGLLCDKGAVVEARRLIELCGYKRRMEQLTDIEQAANSW